MITELGVQFCYMESNKPAEQTELDAKKSLIRKSVMMSVAFQWCIEVSPDDPAEFYTRVTDALPEDVNHRITQTLQQLYPDDSFAPNRLFKFMHEDELLEQFLDGEREDDDDNIHVKLSFFGAMRMLQIKDDIDFRADTESDLLLSAVRERTNQRGEPPCFQQ